MTLQTPQPAPVGGRLRRTWPWQLAATVAACGGAWYAGARVAQIIELAAVGVLLALLLVLLRSRSPRPSCAHCGARGYLHQAGAQYGFRWYCDDYSSCRQRAADRGVTR